MRNLVLTLAFTFLLVLKSLSQSKMVMLVLGSADSVVLKERIDVAARLYAIQKFDAIIVSGGCAAHGSAICEATKMFNGLIDYGVPSQIIYKEENAKTTLQNYVFSRQLKNKQGQRIIQAGDTVYVVSNHWHAISVAARLQKHDKVIAKFFIEGNLIPKPTDKVDYASIFNAEPDNQKFIRKGVWLTPQAVWSQRDSIFYLTQEMVYVSNEDNSEFHSNSRSHYFPYLKGQSQDLSFIDAGKFWYVSNRGDLVVLDKKTGKILQKMLLSDLVKGLPANWEHQMSAGFIKENKIFLFSADALIIGVKKGKFFELQTISSADQYFENWPFSWGKGNISSASIDPQSGAVKLFRNQEFLCLDTTVKKVLQVKPLRLKWID